MTLGARGRRNPSRGGGAKDQVARLRKDEGDEQQRRDHGNVEPASHGMLTRKVVAGEDVVPAT